MAPSDNADEARAQRRQEVVAELGRLALETDDIDGLLREAADAVGDAMDADYCAIHERLPGGDALLLRAGVGWRDGLVGTATVPADAGSQAGYALASEAAVVVEDLASESRFSGSNLLADHGVASGISVGIGSPDDPWGVLALHATDRRTFSDRDATFVRNVAKLLGPAVENERTRQLRERERALERYREYTDDVLDAVDDVFYILDESGDVLRWNESVCEVTDYSNAEVESMHGLEFVAEDDRERVANAIAAVFRTGSAQIEAEFLTADGETIPYEFVASALETPAGEPVLTGIGRDVSEREEHRRRLEETVRKLEESNERLEQFAYAASHDLQEPLRMVSSYLRLIERRYADDLDEGGREFVEFAVDGADRMREMIDGLLAYSRIETRGDPFEPVDLDAVLDDAMQDLRVTLEEAGAEITTDALPRVRGDESQLRQLFENLLSNAVKYVDDEPPRVHVTNERRGDEWSISVSDDGIGIDPDDADRIFTVFQRLHGLEEYPGAGIGLALCRRIVERHDGEIRVDSEPGEGATFTVTLPAEEPHE